MMHGDNIPMTFADGEKGVSETLTLMAAMVHNADRTGEVIQIAKAIAADSPPRNFRAQLGGVFWFLKRHIVFSPDPWQTEMTRDPRQILREIAEAQGIAEERERDRARAAGDQPRTVYGKTSADCDCVAMLGAGLVRALGLPAVFIVMGRPGEFYPGTRRVKLSHVFYGVRLGGRVKGYDPQELPRPESVHRPGVIGRMEVWPERGAL